VVAHLDVSSGVESSERVGDPSGTGGTAHVSSRGGRRRHPVVWFVVRRICAGVVTLLVVSMLIFASTEILPGDVATHILGRTSSPTAITELRNQLDLNHPAVERYGSWLTNFVQGDFGSQAVGVASGGKPAPIWDIVSGRLVNSLILAGLTIVLLIPVGLGLGVLAATRVGRPVDHALSVGALALISLPEFVTGAVLLLILAGALFNVLPAVSLVESGSGVLDRPEILVLPVLTLLAASLAQTIRMIRAGMLNALRSDYVQMSRLIGISERKIVLRYAMRNALAPSVQVIALNIQWLVGGIVVTESVFDYPGIGQALVQAVSLRDVPFVQCVALLIAAVYIALNIAADILVVLLIPRLRTAQ
jgi:peptide/nickel transport system permease protein